MNTTVTTPSDEAPGSQVRRLRVRVTHGDDMGKAVERNSDTPVTIGKSQENDLVLSDRTVSRYHAELRKTSKGVFVSDLGSLNGTFVGQMRVKEAVVPAGTVIRMGASRLIVEDAEAMGSAAAEEDAPEIAGLVGESKAMREVRRQVHRLAKIEASVLILGETGTGKEVVAESIHELGRRHEGPFVVVDCGSLPPTLIASELFGHEKGAFTGAERQRIGAFERADGGTLFLDEIGELPSDLQPMLLGVLERRRLRRLGGDREISVDVRVVAATHRDLRAEANTGSFRADLYFRLAVTRINIAPLRDRPEDIEPLVEHFLREITGSTAAGLFNPQSLGVMRCHRWSGNVRELRNVVEASAAMGDGQLVGVGGEEGPKSSDPDAIRPYRSARADVIHQFERSYLKDLIDRCKGNASQAAREAKMDRPYLLSLLRRHGLR